MSATGKTAQQELKLKITTTLIKRKASTEYVGLHPACYGYISISERHIFETRIMEDFPYRLEVL